ncbi:hypothetical protein PspLS_06259 [Pyricularia sp. CBS 133598]|nr:hypothetical protein PspLS_06259 [Pyricularia sp. CBS 133598]
MAAARYRWESPKVVYNPVLASTTGGRAKCCQWPRWSGGWESRTHLSRYVRI